MKYILLVSIISLFIASCAYNKDELPKPNETGTGGTSTGGVPIITYTSHAKAIIDAQCVLCHSGSGQFPPLNTYSAAFAKKLRIEARTIVQGTMPPSGSLPQTTKDTLQMWINQGALQ